MKSIRETVAVIMVLVGMAIAVDKLCDCVTPQQSAAAAKTACTLVEAYRDTPQVESICATAPEIAELATAAVEAMQAERADGGRKAVECKRIPDTGTCATDAELAAAIRSVKAGRK